MSGLPRRSQLAAAVRQCSERGLRQSSRWAAEQLVGMSRDSPAGNADEHAMVVDDEPAVPSEEEEHTALLAKAYFDLNEFQRAAHALRGARHPRSRFLRWYALFLAGEKHKDEEAVEDSTRDSLSVPSGKPRVVNKQLAQLQSELQPASDEGVLDGFGHYVHALVLRELQRKAEAVSALVRAVAIYPLLWAAWTEIAALVTEPEALSALSLPSHWMRSFFDAHAALEAQQNKQAIAQYEELQRAFPRSTFVKCELAVAQYNLREFDEAQHAFEQLLHDDPCRLDHVDTCDATLQTGGSTTPRGPCQISISPALGRYSNILYVKESKRELSALAHRCVGIDRYRPESCCVIGNYYSLRGEHEKAVMAFRRALKLDRHFLSAWTLMGHEYVELKNTAAAVDAYRHAVDINPKDYRAWYGLGQTYEILQMPYYALFYYRKATGLRPYDSRMWCAMAGCYKGLQRMKEAIQCYQRAEANTDREGIALQELARIFKEEEDMPHAAHYFRRILELRGGERGGDGAPEVQEALSFLANFCKERGELREASQYCTRLVDSGSQFKEEAKAMLREIHARTTSG